MKEVSISYRKARAKGKIPFIWKEAFMKVMAFELNFSYTRNNNKYIATNKRCFRKSQSPP